VVLGVLFRIQDTLNPKDPNLFRIQETTSLRSSAFYVWVTLQGSCYPQALRSTGWAEIPSQLFATPWLRLRVVVTAGSYSDRKILLWENQ